MCYLIVNMTSWESDGGAPPLPMYGLIKSHLVKMSTCPHFSLLKPKTLLLQFSINVDLAYLLLEKLES